MSRSSQLSASNIETDISGIKRIGVMLPIAFFLTAALVAWITVGRMMENRRQDLGTIRSLGFPRNEIMLRYAIQGLLITAPAMVFGCAIAYFLARCMYSLGITYYSNPQGVSG